MDKTDQEQQRFPTLELNYTQSLNVSQVDTSHNNNNVNFDDFNQNNQSINSNALKFQQDVNFIPIPKKYIFLSIFLTITGISFLSFGMYDFFAANQQRGSAFIFFGFLTFLPGVYQVFILIQAYLARSPLEREQILQEVQSIDY